MTGPAKMIGLSLVSLLFTLHCSLATLLLLPGTASPEGPKEQYQKIQKEIQREREKIEEAKKWEHSVLGELDTVNQRLNDIETELRKQRRRLLQTESEMRKVEADISTSRESIERKREWMKRKLRIMNRYGKSYEVFALMASSEDLAQMMRGWKYLGRILQYEEKVIASYIATLRELEGKEKQLHDLRVALQGNTERIRLTEKTLSEKKRDRENLLASVRNEKARHAKLLSELKESSQRLLEMLKKLEEKETYEAKGFTALKGKLAWPVRGKVAIPFGSQKDQRFNTPVFRNGVYIRADDDAIRAVYNGKVVFAEWFRGYGNLLIVNHGEGYHTLYANLAEIFFKVGDIIKIHDVVGKVGESGVLNAPSLYFEIRYKGKPLDPLQWLARR